MEDEAVLAKPRPTKSFYLYHNETLRLIAKNDLEALLTYVSNRVKDKVNLGLHYLGHDLDAIQVIRKSRENVDSTV
jgi:hypothetical protein